MTRTSIWLAAAIVCLSMPVNAALITWGVNGGNWDTGANWIDGAVPGAGDVAVFDVAGWRIRLDVDADIDGLTLGAGAEADRRLLLDGVNDAEDASFTLTTAAITNLSASWLDVASHITAPVGGLTVTTDAGPITLAGGNPAVLKTVTLTGDLTVAGSGNTSIYGMITGAGGIVKDGDGTLVVFVSGFENDFTGDVILNGGVLVLDGFHPDGADPGDSTGSALGVGDIYLNGGTLAFVGGLDEDYSMLDPDQTIYIDGTVTLDAAHGTFVAYGNDPSNTFVRYNVGLAEDDEGDLWFTNDVVIGNGADASHVIFGNAQDGDNLIIEFELADENIADSSTITLAEAGGAKHDLTVYAEVEIEHKITGDGGLRMTADSTGSLFLLNSDNDFVGGFELAGGTLVVGDGALGAGTFTITGGDDVGDVTLVGMLQDFGYDGGEWKDEDGNPWDGSIGTTTIANNVEMQGKFTVGGIIFVEEDDMFVDDEDVPAAFIASNLELSGAVTLTGNTEIAVVSERFVEDGISPDALTALDGLISDDYFTLEISGVIGGAHTLTKSGDRDLILSAENTFTGGLNVAEGTVVFAAENAVAAAPITVGANGVLEFEEDQTLKSLSGAGHVNAGVNSLTLGDGTSNFSGTFENLLDIAVSGGAHTISSVLSMDSLAVGGGAVTLSGNNTYDNGIAVTAGTLTLTGTTTLGAGAIVNAGTLVGNNTSLGSVAIQMNDTSTLKALAAGLTAGNVSVDADADFWLNSNDGALTLNNPTFAGNATINQAGGFNTSIADLDNQAGNTLTLGNGRLFLIGEDIWASGGSGGGIVVNAGATLVVDAPVHNPGDIGGGGTIVKTPNAFATTDDYLDDLDAGGGDADNLVLGNGAVLAASQAQGGQLAIDRTVNVGAGNTASVIGASTVVVNTALNAGDNATLELDAQATMQVSGALNVNSGETLNVTGGGTLAINSNNEALAADAKVAVDGAKLALGSANATGNAEVALNNATVQAAAPQVEIKKATVQGNIEFAGNKVVVDTLETSGGGAAAVKTGAAGIEVATLSGPSNVAVAEGKVKLTGDSDAFVAAVEVGADAELEMGEGAVLGGALTLAGTGTINGTVKGAVLVDDPDALLTGTGDFLGGLAIQQGVLNPGRSPGEIQVSGGDFVLGAGATLNIEVDSAGRHDSIRITDDSNANLLTGAKIIAVAIGNAKDGLYNIITLDGAGEIQVDGVGQAADTNLGAFAQNTEMATIKALVVDATGKIVVMDVEFNASNVEFLTGIKNRSVLSLARMLDSETLVVTDELAAIIGQAQAAGDATQVAAAYAQLTNQLQASASAAAASVVTSINTNLGRRMEGARAAARNSAGPTDGVLVASLTPTAYRPAGSDGWTGFFEGYGSWGDRKNDSGVAGYEYDTYGALLGAEKFYRDDLMVGGSVGYGRTNVKSNDKLSKLDVDSLSLSFYGTWFTDDTYLSLTFGYGYHTYDSARRIVFTDTPLRAKGDFKAQTFTLAPEIGKLFRYQDMEIEPFAGLSFTHYRQRGFREKGAGDASLAVGSYSDDSIASELGVRFRRTWRLQNGGRLTPQLKLSWRHDFGDEVVNTARLAGANASFKTTGIDVVSDTFNLGLGVDWKIDDSKTFYSQYDGEFGSRYKAHTVQAGLKVTF